jgi:hypothetical protein
MFQVPNTYRVNTGPRGTSESAGNNGLFILWYKKTKLFCIASDGLGWEHVSVTLKTFKKAPTWSMMCYVKSKFWGPEDCVIQFHPPKKEYVNIYEGCLHLWRKSGVNIETPDQTMV